MIVPLNYDRDDSETIDSNKRCIGMDGKTNLISFSGCQRTHLTINNYGEEDYRAVSLRF
jgi:hypothetical protein